MINKKNQNSNTNQHYSETNRGTIDLSLSENPLGCSLVVTKLLKELSQRINVYPDPYADNLAQALATATNMKSNNFFISNGSESIIFHLQKLISNQNPHIIIPQLTFPLFKNVARIHHRKITSIPMISNFKTDLRAIASSVTNRTGMICLCNPNNPTGEVISHTRLVSFIRSIPSHIIIVIDEANIEFAGKSVVDQVSTFPNLIILRTFSKAYGLAGLRVGYAVAQEPHILALRQITQPFPISNVSQMLAVAALKDQKFISMTKTFIISQRNLLTKKLSQLGFNVCPSKTNNLFIQIPKQLSSQDFINFLNQSGISVISGEHFEGFDNRFFRLSIKDEKTNQAFLKIMVHMFGINSFNYPNSPNIISHKQTIE